MTLPHFDTRSGAFVLCVRQRRTIPRSFLIAFHHRREVRL